MLEVHDVGMTLRHDERHEMTTTTLRREQAVEPEDLARLFVERANAGDADGLAELYEADAVLGFPPGQVTVGRDAIRAVCERLVAQRPKFALEDPLPTLRHGDLALTATRPADGTGGRAQVARRQPDGTWLRILDRPEAPQEPR
jgi:uncharacterized protein (TIGR02246 family)